MLSLFSLRKHIHPRSGGEGARVVADNFRKADGERAPERGSVGVLDHPSLSLGCRFLGARLQRSNLFCLRSPGCSPHFVFDSQEQSHKPLVSGSHSLSSQALGVPCITSLLLHPFCLGGGRVREEPGWGKIWAGCLGLFMDHIGCICLLVVISGHLAADLIEQECYLGSWHGALRKFPGELEFPVGILYPSFCFGLGAITVMQSRLFIIIIIISIFTPLILINGLVRPYFYIEHLLCFVYHDTPGDLTPWLLFLRWKT